MGMNIVEKILARSAGLPRVVPGDVVFVDVETSVLFDLTFYAEHRTEVLHVHDPKKVVIVYDHFIPAPDVAAAEAQVYGRAFAKKFGIERFHDVGKDQGISHVIVADHAYSLPGTVLVNGDSHTCGGGAFNCAARGVGGPDMTFAVTTGQTWFRVSETVRYDFVGRLRPGVSAKDIFLYIAGRWGAHVNQNVEYGGPSMSTLSLNARRTLATMGAELSADFVIFEPDDLLIDYVRARNPEPFEPQWPDADATYVDRRTLDLSEVVPLVALPDAVVSNSVSIASVAGQRIDQAFIGSCANGMLEDLAAAANIVAGHQVAPGVRFIVTPGSQAIYREAAKAGYVQTLMEAGAIVTTATCGACIGGHMGVLGPNEVCITASTRNFKGRMGDPSARIFMASPSTVAASAIAGHIVGAADFVPGDAA
jgi:3-isopropylmalate/(R)-2-methylmalate dehydratase large subunit